MIVRAVVLFVLGCSPVMAAPQEAPPTVGVFFWHQSPNDAATLAGVRAGLTEARLSVRLVERQADADEARAIAHLRELQQLDCDLVLSLGTRATQLARQHLHDVPIVYAAVTNPVTAGIVDDWATQPEGLCGASNWIDPRSVLEVFRLAVPGLRKLGMLRSRASGTVSAAELAGVQRFLREPDAPAIAVVERVVDDADGLSAAVAELVRQGVDAIWIPIDLTIYDHVPVIERALGGARVPLLTTAAAGVRGGAMVGAAVDYGLHGRRAAALVRRVLRAGRVPAGLAVDRMQSSLVVVSLDAARRNGIELPLSLLAVADELIAEEVR